MAQMVKNQLAKQEYQVRPLGQEDPLEKGMAIISVFFLGEVHGERSLVGYSPWGRKELDTTEHARMQNSWFQDSWVLTRGHFLNRRFRNKYR